MTAGQASPGELPPLMVLASQRLGESLAQMVAPGVDAGSPPTSGVAAFLAQLAAQDMTLAQWARQHGFPLMTCYQVAQGRLLGRHGIARKVARAMNLPLPPMGHQRSVAEAA